MAEEKFESLIARIQTVKSSEQLTNEEKCTPAYINFSQKLKSNMPDYYFELLELKIIIYFWYCRDTTNIPEATEIKIRRAKVYVELFQEKYPVKSDCWKLFQEFVYLFVLDENEILDKREENVKTFQEKYEDALGVMLKKRFPETLVRNSLINTNDVLTTPVFTHERNQIKNF